MLLDKAIGSNGMVREIYLTVSVFKKNYDDIVNINMQIKKIKDMEEIKEKQKLKTKSDGQTEWNMTIDVRVDENVKEQIITECNSKDDSNCKTIIEVIDAYGESIGYCKDNDINEMSKNDIFERVCNWNNLYWYTEYIKSWIKDIYGIDLDEE